MAQDGSMGKGEGVDFRTATPQWLIDLKADAAGMRERRQRPAGLAFGRWLGDFLDQDTPSGLLPAEEKLLFAAAKGEACVLQSRAARVWDVFHGWRQKIQEASVPAEEDFAQAMTKFLEGAPEAVQEVIHDATIQAIVELGLPADWEPKDAAEAETLALAQQAYFARLEAETHPAKVLSEARSSASFFLLAIEAVTQALAQPQGRPLELSDEWLRPLLHSDPLNLPYETREKIEAQPRVLRDFFGEFVRHVKSAPGADQAYFARIKADPAPLKAIFDAAFQRYEREAWRWVDPHDPEVRIRASFLRFLSLGGDDAAPVCEGPLQLAQAYIEDDADLSGSTVSQPLSFTRCYFSKRILLTNATLKTLNFRASRVQAIDAGNARVRGAVFLHGGFKAYGISFPYAAIEGRLSCQGSTFRPAGDFAINFAGAQIAGNADLSDGFLGEGAVFLAGANVRGDLDCAGGTFRNRTADGAGAALDCSNAAITGNAILASGFRSEGAVLFPGAKIGGALNCARGTFVNRTQDGTGAALNAAYAEIGNGVSLSDGFSAEGKVSFHGAHIKSDIVCTGGRFNNSALNKADASPAWAPQLADALILSGAAIDGLLRLGPQGQNASARADIQGSVALAGCHAHEIADHSSSWPAKSLACEGDEAVPAFITLDGFTYDRMAGGGTYDATARKKWLDRQPSQHLGVDFRPQPFEQLIKVYRAMGHESHAREIAKFKGRRRRRANFIKLWHGWANQPRLAQRLFPAKWQPYAAPLNWLAWPFAVMWRAVSRSFVSALYALEWFIVGFGTAYGYGYLRLIAFLFALWMAGGLFYGTVADQGGFAPSNPAIYLNKEVQAKCGKSWTDCKGGPPELPSFSPFAYSLDNMLPVPGLGQKNEWQPIGRPDRPVKLALPSLFWLPNSDPRHSEFPDVAIDMQPLSEGTLESIVRTQALLSWFTLGLLAMMLSGLIKKD
ncbi:MAG: hypothetical protein ACLP7P_08040 [Rhodomicrobium sp.]